VSTGVKRRIVIAAVALGAAGLGDTALATSSPGGTSFFDDVARRLGGQRRLPVGWMGAVPAP
jgi:hypothetical protein